MTPTIPQLILVTGVGKKGQAGEAVAQAFAGMGAKVAIVDRTPAGVEARAAAMRAAGHDVRAFTCDLTDAAQLATLAAEVREAFGAPIDVLVNLAGGFAMSGPVAESDPAAWERQIAVNLTTAYLTTRAFLPALRETRGSIVYFASAAALPGARVAGMAAYAVAKSGVITLMRAVAAEESEHGVRANAVAPAAIRTAANEATMGAGAAYVECDALAAAVLFLASPAARAVTATVLPLH